MDGLKEKISPSSTDLPSKRMSVYLSLRRSLVRLKVDLIVTSGGPHAVSGEESNYYHPHRDDERLRTPWV